MSEAVFELNAEVRSDIGKGASRRLRREQGNIPGVIYGAGKETMSITLRHDDLFHALEHEAFFSHILTIKIDGKKEKTFLWKRIRVP